MKQYQTVIIGATCLAAGIVTKMTNDLRRATLIVDGGFPVRPNLRYR